MPVAIDLDLEHVVYDHAQGSYAKQEWIMADVLVMPHGLTTCSAVS